MRLDCPEEGCDRVGRRGFATKHGLGSHLRWAHGIFGSSASAKYERRKGKRKSKNGRRKKAVVLMPEPKPERKEEQNVISLQESIAIAHAVGQVEGLLLCLARQHGYPAGQFTARCAESLLRASGG